MKIYVKLGTEKRFEKFKKIVTKYNIDWYGGTQFTESFDKIRNRKVEPVAMCIDTKTPHLEYARLSYYKETPNYIKIKLSNLEQFLSEVL